MRSYCEIVASEVLPSFRSIITKELIDVHGLTQKEAGDLLGITQPAVSQYLKEARGLRVNTIAKHPEIMAIIEEIVGDLLNENEHKMVGSKVCKICRMVRIDRLLEELEHAEHECPLEV